MVLNRADFAFPGYLTMNGDICFCHSWGRAVVLLAFVGGAGVLLTKLECIGQPPKAKNWPKCQ